VASNLKDGMLLGGNLPDSLSQYLYQGHDEDFVEYTEDDDVGHETTERRVSEK
jgi:hypothetical protein